MCGMLWPLFVIVTKHDRVSAGATAVISSGTGRVPATLLRGAARRIPGRAHARVQRYPTDGQLKVVLWVW